MVATEVTARPRIGPDMPAKVGGAILARYSGSYNEVQGLSEDCSITRVESGCQTCVQSWESGTVRGHSCTLYMSTTNTPSSPGTPALTEQTETVATADSSHSTADAW